MEHIQPKKHSLRRLLDNAKGVSESIIAVILDIRGFSSFAMDVESVEAAAFLKRVYKEMIDRYFNFATFIKPTGDGLLLAFAFDDTSLKFVAPKVIESCIKCLAEFPSLCKGDLMIDFKTPENIGIGICKGAATRLISGDTIIDYSGRPFNIASRLMELARPSGIVIYGTIDKALFPKIAEDQFATEQVYLSGISKDSPTPIYYTKAFTVITS